MTSVVAEAILQKIQERVHSRTTEDGIQKRISENFRISKSERRYKKRITSDFSEGEKKKNFCFSSESAQFPSKETFLAKALRRGPNTTRLTMSLHTYLPAHMISYLCLHSFKSDRHWVTVFQHLSSFLLDSAMWFQLPNLSREICCVSSQCFLWSNKDTQKKNIQARSFQDPQADTT